MAPVRRMFWGAPGCEYGRCSLAGFSSASSWNSARFRSERLRAHRTNARSIHKYGHTRFYTREDSHLHTQIHMNDTKHRTRSNVAFTFVADVLCDERYDARVGGAALVDILRQLVRCQPYKRTVSQDQDNFP